MARPGGQTCQFESLSPNVISESYSLRHGVREAPRNQALRESALKKFPNRVGNRTTVLPVCGQQFCPLGLHEHTVSTRLELASR